MQPPDDTKALEKRHSLKTGGFHFLVAKCNFGTRREKAEPAIFPSKPNVPAFMMIAFVAGLLFAIPGGILILVGILLPKPVAKGLGVCDFATRSQGAAVCNRRPTNEGA